MTEKNLKVFEPLLFASNSVEEHDKNSKITGTWAETEDIFREGYMHEKAGRDSKSIFSPNGDSSSTRGTFLVGTLSLCFRFLDFFLYFL